MLKQEDYKQHISEQFNTELEEIKNHLLEMGGKVEKQLIEAVEALVSRNTSVAEEIISRDHEVNQMEMRIDDDQDSVWLRVDVAGGASCHVGYRSCFYRSVPLGPVENDIPPRLNFEESEKVFDPVAVYGDAPNPTKL